MPESLRPKRVVILDADNPMAEIHGEFFWREDHEQIVADARRRSYDEGFAAGAQAQASRPINVVVRRRGRLRSRLLLGTLILGLWLTVLVQQWR